MHVRFRFLVFASCLCALALGGFFDGHARALDASEQSVDVLSAGPQSWDSCVQERGGVWWGLDTGSHLEGTAECDPADMGGGPDTADGNGDGDWIYGDQGNDNLHGNGGNDYIAAGCRSGGCFAGNFNNIYGETGNDILAARNQKGGDNLYGGSGTEDHCWYDVGSTDTVSGCEFLNR